MNENLDVRFTPIDVNYSPKKLQSEKEKNFCSVFDNFCSEISENDLLFSSEETAVKNLLTNKKPLEGNLKNEQNSQNNVRAQEKARHYAKYLRAYIDDNSILGATDTAEFHTVLKLINESNVVDVLQAYDKISPDESFIDAVLSEYADSQSSRSEVLQYVYDKLDKHAKNKGVLEDNASNEIITQAFVDFNKDEIRRQFNVKMRAIKNADLVNQTSGKTATSTDAVNQLELVSSESQNKFKNQLDSQGWIGDLADGIGRIWSSQNREELVRADLETFDKQVMELKEAAGESQEKFEAKFEEIFGKKFDANQVKAYQKNKEKYIEVISLKENVDSTEKQLGELLSNSQLRAEYTQYSNGFGPKIKVETASKNDVYQKREKSFISFLGEGDLEKGKEYLVKIFEKNGINPDETDIDKKYQVLRQTSLEIRDIYEQQYKKALAGKPYETYEKAYKLSYNSAYGTKNDIAKRVEEYNVSQQKTVYIMKSATVAAASTATLLLTGGSAAPLIAGAVDGGLNLALDVSDKLTSKNGLNADDLLASLKNAGLSTASWALSFGVGKGLKAMEAPLKVSSVGEKFALHVGAQTVADVTIDSVKDYISTGHLTIDNVILNLTFDALGNVISFSYDMHKAKKLAQKTASATPKAELPDAKPASAAPATPKAELPDAKPASAAPAKPKAELPDAKPATFNPQKQTANVLIASDVPMTPAKPMLSSEVKIIDLSQLRQMDSVPKLNNFDMDVLKKNVEVEILNATSYHEMVKIEKELYKIKNVAQRNELLAVIKERRTKLNRPFRYNVKEIIQADRVNIELKQMGYTEKPYKPGNNVSVITLENDMTFARVFTDGVTSPQGGWIMKFSDVEGLSPTAIKERFALPYMPTHMVDVSLSKGTTLRMGEANGIKDFGKAAFTQFDLMGQRIGEFTNARKIVHGR